MTLFYNFVDADGNEVPNAEFAFNTFWTMGGAKPESYEWIRLWYGGLDGEPASDVARCAAPCIAALEVVTDTRHWAVGDECFQRNLNRLRAMAYFCQGHPDLRTKVVT